MRARGWLAWPLDGGGRCPGETNTRVTFMNGKQISHNQVDLTEAQLLLLAGGECIEARRCLDHEIN